LVSQLYNILNNFSSLKHFAFFPRRPLRPAFDHAPRRRVAQHLQNLHGQVDDRVDGRVVGQALGQVGFFNPLQAAERLSAAFNHLVTIIWKKMKKHSKSHLIESTTGK